ncbi:MAG: [protein-PII] uridylyltransferase [Pseudomonadota bacterium]
MNPSLVILPEIDLTLCEKDPTSAVRSFLFDRRKWFDESLAAGCDALNMCCTYSEMIDGVVRALYNRAGTYADKPTNDRSAVLALGGYGRREMGLLTDIDLLFLIDTQDEEHARAITDGILYPFWDNGMQVGGATRTLADCQSIMNHDERALTAMMDARLVSGDAALLEDLFHLLTKHFADSSSQKNFVHRKLKEHHRRLTRYGGSIYLLQPNLKEGEGGLRELHTLRWIAKAACQKLDASELMKKYVPEKGASRAIEDAHRFIWASRHSLHLSDGTTNDRLSESIQGDVAKRLGYQAMNDSSAAEVFMSDYYKHAESMHLLCERGMERIKREIMPPSRARAIFWRRPLPGGLIKTEFGTLSFRRKDQKADALSELNLFATARRTGVPLDPITKGKLCAKAQADARQELAAFEAARSLRDVFSGIENLDRTLMDMHECGALIRWFPEMASIFHKVQHDGFHFYTAGVHSIKAVGELAMLPTHVLSCIRRPHVLSLATLFHDIGKGQGGDHSERGAQIASDIAGRMGYDNCDISDIAFLIRSHLLMSTIAFRRDVKDPDLVERFAQSLRSPEILTMLYLLTFADLRAIGPNVWSEWKGGLLAEFYKRTYAHMSAGGMTPAKRKREADRLISAVKKRVGRDIGESEIKGFLLKLPSRYLHSVPAEAIAAHILFARNVDKEPMATFIRDLPDRGSTEFSVVTKDCPGLFAKIAGVLSANSVNIVDAELFTSSDGTAIDVIWVTDSTYSPIKDPDVWTRIRKDLTRVLPDNRNITHIVGARFKKSLLSMRGQNRPALVTIENDVSAFHTVVEVRAYDRRGLLYTIASTFHELGCTIDLARITTHIDRIIDVFYIRDADGKKIDSRERLDQIRSRLIDALE